MRNFSLGVSRRDIMLFALASLVAIGLTIGWHLALVDLVGSFSRGNEQRANKYFLTVVIFGLAFVAALASLALAQRGGARPSLFGLLPGFLVRFGIALQLFGTLITPIGLFYATNPTRSVPVGFAAFSAVILGIIIAGVGGNMLLPRRA